MAVLRETPSRSKPVLGNHREKDPTEEELPEQLVFPSLRGREPPCGIEVEEVRFETLGRQPPLQLARLLVVLVCMTVADEDATHAERCRATPSYVRYIAAGIRATRPTSSQVSTGATDESTAAGYGWADTGHGVSVDLRLPARGRRTRQLRARCTARAAESASAAALRLRGRQTAKTRRAP